MMRFKLRRLKLQRNHVLQKRERKVKHNYVFRSVSNCPSSLLPIFPPNYSAYRDMNPIKLFELFYNELLIANILGQTKLYSITRSKNVFVASKAESRVFRGMIMLSGCIKLPQRKSYWSHDSDVGNDEKASCEKINLSK